MFFGSTTQFRKAVMGYFGNLRDDVAGINNSADVGHGASIRRRCHLTGGEVLFVGDYAQNKEQEIHGVVRQRRGPGAQRKWRKARTPTRNRWAGARALADEE